MCLTSNLVTLYYTDTRAAQFWIIEDHVFFVLNKITILDLNKIETK